MNLKEYIRSIPDYPKKGILFRDITTLIKDEKAFAETIEQIIIKTLFYIAFPSDNKPSFGNLSFFVSNITI